MSIATTAAAVNDAAQPSPVPLPKIGASHAVHDIILGPLVERFPPPFHLRHNPDARLRALADYEAVLSRFDRDTLTLAWNAVIAAHRYWCWPSLGEFVAAGEAFARRRHQPSEEENRKSKAIQLAEMYTARYLKTSQLAKLARREGWLTPLRGYVADAAWVQAQLICGVEHIGWNAGLADELGVFTSSRAAFAAYQAIAGKAIERGSIRIHVPAGRVRSWRSRCQEQAEAVSQIPISHCSGL